MFRHRIVEGESWKPLRVRYARLDTKNQSVMRPRVGYINKGDKGQDQISRCARKEKRAGPVLMVGILSFLIDSVDKRHVVHMRKGAPGIRSCSEEGYEYELCSFGHESRFPSPQLTVLRPRVISLERV